eukprot:TRINITY_DN2149_c0_g1_i2.p1 TRINITY_DN2149_c0_g1~~TRINITY_DN2149_c0_g1_i2.p1  ORF type:complete len:453 (-),score=94.58 TRINITY_DN2149_c0_g1_i2:13-1296(-)
MNAQNRIARIFSSVPRLRIRAFSSQTPVPESSQLSQLDLEFLEWCKENGISHPKVELSYKQIGSIKRRGLFATEPINAGEYIVAVPASLTFSRYNYPHPKTLALTSRLFLDGKLAAQPLADDILYLELAILLMMEYVDPASLWRPWIRALPPRTANAAVLLNHEIRDGLGERHPRLSEMVERVTEYQNFLHNLCDKNLILGHFLKEAADKACQGNLQEARAIFMWAVSMTDSRSVRGRALVKKAPPSKEGELEVVASQYVVPLFDFVNHPDPGVPANVTTQFLAPPPSSLTNELREWVTSLHQAGVSFAQMRARPEPYRVLQAVSDIQAGQELFYSYATSSEAGETSEAGQASGTEGWSADGTDDLSMLFGFGFVPSKIAREMQKVEQAAKKQRALFEAIPSLNTIATGSKPKPAQQKREPSKKNRK